MNLLRYIFTAAFVLLILIAANSVFGGLIIALLQACELGVFPSLQSVLRGYAVHFQMLLALSDPLAVNLGPLEKGYAVLDTLSGWLVVPAVSSVIIDKVLTLKKDQEQLNRELQIVKDKMKSRVSAYEAVKKGLCPSCGGKIGSFDDDEKFGFVCMNCGEALIEAKLHQKVGQNDAHVPPGKSEQRKK